ncbi:MAG: hypothetical protein GY925_26760, partial [Actinomycetia bacterium]|nr:hypothetical protein [Actinomycetes bacterium]
MDALSNLNDDSDSGDLGGDSEEVAEGSGLVAPFAGEFTMVDGVGYRGSPGSALGQRRSPVPAWLSTPGGRRQTIELAIRQMFASVWFQFTMLPVYWTRLSRQAPNGIVRGLGAWWRYTVDAEGLENLRAVRSHHAEGARGNVEILADQHRHAIRTHLIADVVALLFVLIGSLIVWAVAPWWGRALLTIGVPGVGLPILGLVGRDKSVPIVERWLSTGAIVPKLTEGLIVQSLRDARIAGMDRAFKDQGDRTV